MKTLHPLELIALAKEKGLELQTHPTQIKQASAYLKENGYTVTRKSKNAFYVQAVV